jgi:hypothetical protein
MARNSRSVARRALRSEDLVALGTYLLLWVHYPKHRHRAWWLIEVEASFNDTFDSLVKEQHDQKGNIVVDTMWFTAKDVQEALDWFMDMSRLKAERRIRKELPRHPTFEALGITINDERGDSGPGMSIRYKGKTVISTN